MNSDELNIPEQESVMPETREEEETTAEEFFEEDSAQLEVEEQPVSNSILENQDATEAEMLSQQLVALRSQKEILETEVAALQGQKEQLSEQVDQAQAAMGRLVQEGLIELEQKRSDLQASLEKLERRRERIRQEMRTTFAGASQELAIRVQGFKDYLVGSLQDLAIAAEQLELPVSYADDSWETSSYTPEAPRSVSEPSMPQFVEKEFEGQVQQIRSIIDQYRTLPDYYGPPWQLRRTFEPIHAEKVESWFFTQGGRGAVKTMGSRLQNILVASAVMSIMRQINGDRVRTLVLANSPERLGEWRRGLQDCLGISRVDFGPERGVVLFEAPEALVMKAERLLDEKLLPLIVIDETEEQVNLSLLQFPLWLAFAPDAQQMSSYLY